MRIAHTDESQDKLRPLSRTLLVHLDLRGAVVAEAACVRNLVPSEPIWASTGEKADQLGAYSFNLLQAGFMVANQIDVLARKPGIGVRPVPILGPIERVVYHALAERVMQEHVKPDRSGAAYVDFVAAPLKQARKLRIEEHGSEDVFGFSMFGLSSGPVKYITSSDISNFYQYVDHEILRDELVRQGSDSEAVDALMEFLYEVVGRNHGLPQLLDPSDWLSEVYIRRLERQLSRQGLDVWRFNDDFRIASREYEDALLAVEILEREARSLGLSINEFKTRSYLTETYTADVLIVGVTEVNEDAALSVEEIVGDYLDTFMDDAEAAARLVAGVSTDEVANAAADDSDGTRINLRHASTQDVRLLTRAINGLTVAKSFGSLSQMSTLVAFVPSLTPTIAGYLRQSLSTSLESALQSLANIVIHASLRDWQRLWILDVIRECLDHEPTDKALTEVLAWTALQMEEPRSMIVRLSAARVLAARGDLSITDAENLLNGAPDALFMYSVDLVATYSRASATIPRSIAAWCQETGLHRILAAPVT